MADPKKSNNQKNGKGQPSPKDDVIPINTKLLFQFPTAESIKKVTCGDIGGRTKNGTPCKRPTARDGRPCTVHRTRVGPRPTGRPRIIETPEQFDHLVDRFIAECTLTDVPPTFSGMALSLGFSDRESLYGYERDHPNFSCSVKRARSLIEVVYERRLHGTAQVAGAIFALKQVGWRDTQEIAHSGHLDIDLPQIRKAVEDRLDGIRSRMGPVALLPISKNGSDA